MLDYKITDADIIGGPEILLNEVGRYASRGVLLDGAGNIALMHMAENGYVKLPGGGMEGAETPEDAFLREVKEETGCSLQNLRRIGHIEEHKFRTHFLQYSYCFLADKSEDGAEINLTDSEKALGLGLIWVPYDKALERMTNALKECTDYSLRYMLFRDRLIVKSAQEYITFPSTLLRGRMK